MHIPNKSSFNCFSVSSGSLPQLGLSTDNFAHNTYSCHTMQAIGLKVVLHIRHKRSYQRYSIARHAIGSFFYFYYVQNKTRSNRGSMQRNSNKCYSYGRYI